MEINFVVSYMTEFTSASVFISCFCVGTEDNAVIHEKTHGALFASNEYFKSII